MTTCDAYINIKIRAICLGTAISVSLEMAQIKGMIARAC
jgi:hypothetical protein